MSNITFAPFPIPVVIEGLGDCIIVSQTNTGTFEDDLWVVAKCDGGQMLHVRTSQMKMHHNQTMGITKESITERAAGDWLFNPPHSEIIEKKEWDDLLVAKFAGYAEEKIKQHGASYLPNILEKFKEKHNIK